MKTMSISLSETLYERIKHMIPAKKVSKFVAEAINKELSLKEKNLALAYIAAENDEERNKELADWDAINDW